MSTVVELNEITCRMAGEKIKRTKLEDARHKKGQQGSLTGTSFLRSQAHKARHARLTIIICLRVRVTR